jgi:REP element-mobilizing transposase RayT
MGSKYAIRSDHPYFLTHTINGWADLFTRKELAEIVVNALNYCVDSKGLIVHAWCLMPSHLHMIANTNNAEIRLSDVMRDFKKFTSKAIIRFLQPPAESRRDWLLKLFSVGKNNFQVWQEGMHPEALFTRDFMRQKLNYIHYNPVAAGLVYTPESYVYSSALEYYTGQKGLVNLELV